MAVVFETAGTNESWISGLATAGTKKITVNTDPSTSARVAVLAFEWVGTVNMTAVPFTATYGGLPMTLTDVQQFYDSNRSTAAMFVLENAPGGPQDFLLSFSGASTQILQRSLLIAAGTWTGVESIGTAATHVGGTSATSNAITVSSVADAHRVITVHAVGAGLSSGSYSKTIRAKSDLYNGGALYMGDSAGAASVTASITQGSTSKWAAWGLALAPAVDDFGAELKVDLALSVSSGTYRAVDPAPDRTWFVDGGFVDLRGQDTRVGARARGIAGAHLDDDGLVVFDFEDGLESMPLDLAGPPGQVNDAAVHYLVWVGNVNTAIGSWPARPDDELPVLWIGGRAPNNAPVEQRAGDVWIPTVGDERPFGPVLEALQLIAAAAQTIPYFSASGVAGSLGFSTDTAFASPSDFKVVSQKAVKSYVDAGLLGITNALTQAVTVVGENPQTGTAYTLAVSDNTKVVSMNNLSANVVTIPKDVLPVGWTSQVISLGTGQTSFAKGDPSLFCRAANDFVIIGDLSA